MSASGSAKSRMERILRLQEEIDQIKGDIREIYAEEKADGGDKTAMGAAISYIRKRAKDKEAFDEREALASVYINAFEASGPAFASHTHARETSQSYAQAKGSARQARARLRASERMADAKTLSAEAAALGLIDPDAHAETVRIADAIARNYGAGVIDPETGEITEHEQPETAAGSDKPQEAAVVSEYAGTSSDENPAPHSPSAATPAEPEAVSPTPPAASGTISPSSGFQGVTGGNPSEPSPDAGAEDVSAPAERKNAQSEQAAHHSDDDVPAFLKQERVQNQPNPKCQKPGNCKWDHGQVSCWRCNSAPAARESEVA